MSGKFLWVVVLGIALTPAAGCGGGGHGGGGGPVTVTLASVASVDGMIVDTPPPGVFTTFDLQVGDTSTNNSKRGFLRFLLSSIPPGAIIDSATLSVHQSVVNGVPYSALGAVTVDHMDIGSVLDGGDFVGSVLFFNFGTLSTDATLGYKSLDVTSRVAADMAASKPDSDYRLHTAGTTNSDSIEDSSHWDDAEDSFGSGNVPHLTVTYH